jgi:predicted RNase H-like HicB family nuclease
MTNLRLRVEYAYDPESRNWSFRVPSLGIVGGADTREEAEGAAIEAVAYALEDDQETGEAADAEVRYLQLAVQS